MTDADRIHAYGPLQPAAPDDWHDRPRRGVIRLTLLSAGVMIGAAWAVFAMGGA